MSDERVKEVMRRLFGEVAEHSQFRGHARLWRDIDSTMTDLAAEAARLRELVEEAKGLLTSMEWEGELNGWPCCPSCREDRPTEPDPDVLYHDVDCALNRWLTRASEVTG